MRQTQRGEVLLKQGQAAEAERLFRDLLAQMDEGAAYDVEYDRAMTLTWLGDCLAAHGHPTQAIPQHRQALALFERISSSNVNASALSGQVT